MIFLYITNPSEEEAKKLARILLEKKLIACANMFPIRSLYEWEGEMKDDQEIVLICKSAEDRFEDIKKTVQENHSYDVPCITKLDAEANDSFSRWVKEQTR